MLSIQEIPDAIAKATKAVDKLTKDVAIVRECLHEQADVCMQTHTADVWFQLPTADILKKLLADLEKAKAVLKTLTDLQTLLNTTLSDALKGK
ncbi:hypothetical protein PP101_20 [Pectobacterium phage PP101]|uniref:Uncharacterized protein n=1 Tax=Pectobacterium phage PP101 TaxID=1916414 RepID=A0A1J0MF41_9CAUD|nr:hypothetical protein HOR42_gp20 [Pectobacterium phage PP101]APD19740.1 hypothetical protein PP101_20 [Pectobacterium phage PP101]